MAPCDYVGGGPVYAGPTGLPQPPPEPLPTPPWFQPAASTVEPGAGHAPTFAGHHVLPHLQPQGLPHGVRQA
jgi:hypothetical protein